MANSVGSGEVGVGLEERRRATSKVVVLPGIIFSNLYV